MYQEKDSPFECGFHSFLGQNRTQFSISFFIFALLFLLFDLEILLVYPYVVSAYTNGIYGLVIMLIFFLALTLGFAFELGKNALKIDSRQTFTLLDNRSSKVVFLSKGVCLEKFIKIITRIKAIFTMNNLCKVLVIFSVGFICRWFINDIIGINVFKDYTHSISLSFYAFMAFFVVVISELFSGVELKLPSLGLNLPRVNFNLLKPSYLKYNIKGLWSGFDNNKLTLGGNPSSIPFPPPSSSPTSEWGGGGGTGERDNKPIINNNKLPIHKTEGEGSGNPPLGEGKGKRVVSSSAGNPGGGIVGDNGEGSSNRVNIRASQLLPLPDKILAPVVDTSKAVQEGVLDRFVKAYWDGIARGESRSWFERNFPGFVFIQADEGVVLRHFNGKMESIYCLTFREVYFGRGVMDRPADLPGRIAKFKMLHPDRKVPEPWDPILGERDGLPKFSTWPIGKQSITYKVNWRILPSDFKEEIKKDDYDTTRDRRVQVNNLLNPTDGGSVRRLLNPTGSSSYPSSSRTR